MGEISKIPDPPTTFRTPKDILGQLNELKERWKVNKSQAIIRCIQYTWRNEIGYRKAGYTKTDKHGEQSSSLSGSSEYDDETKPASR